MHQLHVIITPRLPNYTFPILLLNRRKMVGPLTGPGLLGLTRLTAGSSSKFPAFAQLRRRVSSLSRPPIKPLQIRPRPPSTTVPRSKNQPTDRLPKLIYLSFSLANSSATLSPARFPRFAAAPRFALRLPFP